MGTYSASGLEAGGPKHGFRALAGVLVLVVMTAAAGAQQSASPAAGSHEGYEACTPDHVLHCTTVIARDQAKMWTSPFRVKARDLKWLVPLGVAVGVAMHFDRSALTEFGTPATAISVDKNVSTYFSPYVLAGSMVGVYGLGEIRHSEPLKETGILGAEAVADALLLSEGVKLATQRDRPTLNSDGKFWPHGTRQFNFNSSMPSGHATVSWALARVIAKEYPEKPWLGFLCYAGATTVSAARILSRQHFPSDVLVGGAIGYLSGSYIVRHHSHRRWQVSLQPRIDGFTRGATLIIQPGDDD